jgi:hypothetical protein
VAVFSLEMVAGKKQPGTLSRDPANHDPHRPRISRFHRSPFRTSPRSRAWSPSFPCCRATMMFGPRSFCALRLL